MSTALWPEGYYDTDGLVSGEFTEINQKDCCKLTFQMANGGGTKTSLLFFNAGENERISMEQLAKLGWNGNAERPEWATPQAVTQLKCEHYRKPDGKVIESWKVAGTTAPIPKDRAKVLEAKFRQAGGTPPPSGRPSAPPASRPTQPPSSAPPAAPRSGPPPAAPSVPPPGTPVQHTQDSAWAVWEQTARERKEKHNTGTGVVDTNEWVKAVQSLMAEFGKHETQFGPEEWGRMADLGDIPF